MNTIEIQKIIKKNGIDRDSETGERIGVFFKSKDLVLINTEYFNHDDNGENWSTVSFFGIVEKPEKCCESLFINANRFCKTFLIVNDLERKYEFDFHIPEFHLCYNMEEALNLIIALKKVSE